jgi:hypothetical protein
MRDILDVIKNVESIYNNDSNLAVLKDLERVLDEMDIYVYDNWLEGELASGPKIDRHWVTAEFMWPYKRMPDPDGAKRLMEIGCRVKYEKTEIIEPRKIRDPDDFRPGTKKGKLDTKPVWIVKIMMPKKVVFDIFNSYMDRARETDKAEKTLNDTMQAGGAAPVVPPPPAPEMPAAAPAPMAGAV